MLKKCILYRLSASLCFIKSANNNDIDNYVVCVVCLHNFCSHRWLFGGWMCEMEHIFYEASYIFAHAMPVTPLKLWNARTNVVWDWSSLPYTTEHSSKQNFTSSQFRANLDTNPCRYRYIFYLKWYLLLILYEISKGCKDKC